MDIILMSRRLTGAVEQLVQRTRRVYYEVVLMGHTCPACGGTLAMIGESRCRCSGCGQDWDPTVEFQRCGNCGGVPRLRIRRYRCTRCGEDLASRFVFDGLVFDAEYFRSAVAASRARKRERRTAARLAAIENRSNALEAPELDLRSVPGLIEALNSMTGPPEIAFAAQAASTFDLRRYERHIQAHIHAIEINFDEIPQLVDRVRIDRIWRFIALIFLAHAGVVAIRQSGVRIMVRSNAD